MDHNYSLLQIDICYFKSIITNTDVRDMQSLKWWDESTKKIGEFDQTAFL